MDEGLKGAECADSAARLPLPAIVPTANASTEIITPVHIFCLQNQIRDMGHNLGVSCQAYMAIIHAPRHFIASFATIQYESNARKFNCYLALLATNAGQKGNQVKNKQESFKRATK